MARAEPIQSIQQLQRLVPTLVKALNADEALMKRALVNPLLALEELGYRLADELRPQVERRVRFKVETAHRLDALADEVFKHAGERLDLDSPVALDRLLYERLKLPRGTPAPAAQAAQGAVMRGQTFIDPLERLRGKHPVLEPLLAYRKLDASAPRLAPPELYERVRRGDVKLPVLHAKARLQRGATPK